MVHTWKELAISVILLANKHLYQKKGQFLGRINRGKTYIFFLLAIFIVIEQILQKEYLFAKKKNGL